MIDEELFKIPCDVEAAHGGPDDGRWVGHDDARVVTRGRKGSLEQLEKRVCVMAVDFNLLEHVPERLEVVAWSDVAQTDQHLLVGGVLLVTKLIGREAEHRQTVLELQDEIVHLREVPRGRGS